MSGFWTWIGCNSTQLQAIGSIAVVLVTIALVVVAVRQAMAANAQAEAAKNQAKAARAQVEAANRQIDVSFIIGDTQISPNISITPAERGGTIVKDTMAILNNGNGPATDVMLRYRDESGTEIGLNNDVLVRDDSVPATFEAGRAARYGFKLTYRTAFGTRYELEFDWNETSGVPINRRLRLISRDSLR